MEQLKERRLRLNDDQRRRLAVKGKRLGRRLLIQVATIVTPYTILRWHHRVPLDALHEDPANARAHDDRNLDAIPLQLSWMSQRLSDHIFG